MSLSRNTRNMASTYGPLQNYSPAQVCQTIAEVEHYCEPLYHAMGALGCDAVRWLDKSQFQCAASCDGLPFTELLGTGSRSQLPVRQRTFGGWKTETSWTTALWDTLLAFGTMVIARRWNPANKGSMWLIRIVRWCLI